MMDEVTVDNSFLLDIVRSNPASITVLNGNDLKIEYCNERFINNFCDGNLNYKENVCTFADMLDTDQQERLKTQLQDVKENALARNKYIVYKLNSYGIQAQVYIYAAPLNDTGLSSDLYQLLILSDISTSHLPFISFDTRELFFRQFNNTYFGTFEWWMSQNKFFWTDGLYEIYEIDKAGNSFEWEELNRYVHPEDKEMVNAALSSALENGEDIDIEYRIVTKRKNIKNIHAIAKVIYDKEGRQEKLIGSIRDITGQRKAEEELKDNLKVLNRSNKDLEEFAYVASHDLQEPLRKISTFSDRLNEKYKEVLTGEGTMYLERMMASADNMRTLINNLLEFSRISKSTVPFADINLNFILQQVKTDLELKIEETGTTIRSTQLPTISASLTQMKQLFENIISNAIKFRKQDVSPVIEIEAALLPAGEATAYKLSGQQQYYRIQVTDNGIGFEDEYAQRIFQVFQRLHGKAEYPGSGIGLAICQKILEHHSGVIFAENIPGTGARFIFIIPQHQPDNIKKA